MQNICTLETVSTMSGLFWFCPKELVKSPNSRVIRGMHIPFPKAPIVPRIISKISVESANENSFWNGTVLVFSSPLLFFESSWSPFVLEVFSSSALLFDVVAASVFVWLPKPFSTAILSKILMQFLVTLIRTNRIYMAWSTKLMVEISNLPSWKFQTSGTLKEILT